ncbi:hypothetical protein [Aliivibrio sifiae]|uniref:Uncharacterized protein n=1 Tax=Aliivibrio sifiae TaxID=566293 RepID=A0A2S7X843_9GAMM|nr:hypothetical protein [Aliivibrio sifiae]PQJ87501.1 hypothetical protein BTO23_15450 [Aliivibrio sifiae]
MASIKETFENHPVVFGGALLIAGFISGYKVYPELHPLKEPKQQEPVIKIEKVREVVGCEVIGFETLEKNHHSRLSALQNQLMAWSLTLPIKITHFISMNTVKQLNVLERISRFKLLVMRNHYLL